MYVLVVKSNQNSVPNLVILGIHNLVFSFTCKRGSNLLYGKIVSFVNQKNQLGGNDELLEQDLRKTLSYPFYSPPFLYIQMIYPHCTIAKGAVLAFV